MLLQVPPLEESGKRCPSLGDQVIEFIETYAVFGPGSLKGLRARLNSDQKAFIYRAYEVWPRKHRRAGKRRFQRCGLSVRKGSAKTELLAWLAFAELHPLGPVRFAGFEADGVTLKQGRAVADPYIPMMANTQEQVSELAFGALMVICEYANADRLDRGEPLLFDVGMDRIIRYGDSGEAAGKAVPIAGAPNARDGARTTFQAIDESHRLYLPNHKAAVETMIANLPKRPLEDPWMCSATTAGQPGQLSVAEDEYFEAEAIHRGEVDRPSFFFMHRQASDGFDLNLFEDRISAITEASGPDVAAWSDIEGIAGQWDRPKADRTYLERVWTNRWIAQEAQAFNPKKWNELALLGDQIKPNAYCTLGFDGARFRDATAFVLTDIRRGFQQPVGLWERPENAPDDWEIPEDQVDETFRELMSKYRILKAYCDPPHWNSTIGNWYVKHPDVVVEWWTNKYARMITAIQNYSNAIDLAALHHDGDPDMARHMGNAGKHYLNKVLDEHGERKWILGKLHPERKFDACMAAILSWQARADVLPDFKPKRRVVQRIR